MSSRPKLTPLSNLLPAKGAAQRPEPLPEPVEQASIQASAQESMLASELASKHAEAVLGNEGAAVEQASRLMHGHDRMREPKIASILASEQPSKQPDMTSRPQAGSHAIDEPDEFKNGPRSAVSFRMTERLQERLREFAHRSRRSKQDILDQAVHELLSREGF